MLAYDDYYVRRLDEYSRSGNERFRVTPAHFRAWVEEEQFRDSPTLLFGRAFHSALLEPERYVDRYVAQPHFGDGRKKGVKEAKAEWAAQYGHMISIPEEDALLIQRMLSTLYSGGPNESSTLVAKMLEQADTEVLVTWMEGNLKLKSKLDAVRVDLRLVIEIKTCDHADERSFKQDVFRYGYHRQEAFYRRAARTNGWEPRFLFVAWEKCPPYAPVVYRLRPEWVKEAEEELERNIALYSECLEKNQWPTWPKGIVQL